MEIRTYMFEPTCLETKIDSYNQIDTKQRQEQVLEVLGDEMLTAKEIAIRMHEKGYTNNDDRNNASPRLNELVNLGLVVIYGKKKCEFSGKTVAVFKKIKSEENDYKEKYENLKVTYDNLKVTYENIKNIEAFTRTRIKELKKENESLRKELAMKIFYKKDFYGVLEEKNKLQEEYEKYKERKENVTSILNKRCTKQFEQITSLSVEIEKLKKDNEILKNKFVTQSASKGGFVKENHKLKNTIKGLNEKIKQQEEKLSKRYILKTIKPGRTPNMNKTKISKPMSNTVRNYMKREFDNV